MASKASPPRRKKGVPPKKDDPVKNNLKTLQEDVLVPMNFKTPSSFKKDYRVYAAESGMSMVDVLKESFKLYREKYPI